MRLSYHLMTWAVDGIGKGVGWLGKVWAAHRRLIRDNKAYESAMAAAGAHVFTQTSWERLLAALITGLLDIYAVLRRAATWSTQPGSTDDWGPDATFEDGWSTT